MPGIGWESLLHLPQEDLRTHSLCFWVRELEETKTMNIFPAQMVQRPRRFRMLILVTPLGALVALGGFLTTWLPFGPGGPTSGWDIAQGASSFDLLLFPGVLPEAFGLLWLVPASALVLLGVGIARLFGFQPRWFRLWSLLLTSGCLLLMGGLCFSMMKLGHMRFSFWLTGLGLLVSALGLLLPEPGKASAARQAGSDEIRRGRRNLLTKGLNVGSLLVVGGSAAWLAFVLGTRFVKATAHRFLLPIGTYQGLFQPNGHALAWLPKSTQLVEALGGVLRCWEITTAQVVRTYVVLPELTSVQGTTSFGDVDLSRDGRFLATTVEGGSVCLWETSTGRFLRTLSLEHGHNYGTAFSPDGAYLATAGWLEKEDHDLLPAVLKIWRVSDGTLFTFYQAPSQQAIVRWSPDGRLIAALGEGPIWGVVEIREFPSGRSIFTDKTVEHSAVISDIAWAPDSRRLAIARSSLTVDVSEAPVQIWDVQTSKLLLTYHGHWLDASGLSWSPDGTRLAAGGADGTVQIWNAATGERLFVYQGHDGSFDVSAVAWSPDGKSIASGSRDGTVHIWDARAL